MRIVRFWSSIRENKNSLHRLTLRRSSAKSFVILSNTTTFLPAARLAACGG
jgi:hypothetical protein